MEAKSFDNSELSVRALNVLRHLGIYSASELREATLPEVGTLLYYSFLLDSSVYYTKRIDSEVREFLNSSSV